MTLEPAPESAHATTLHEPAALMAPPVRRSSGLRVIAVIGIVILSILAFFVVAYLVAGLGTSAFVIAGVMALVPLGIVFAGVRWIDRWEPEPRAAIVFAFLWGSGVAVIIALAVGAEVDNVIDSLGGPGSGYEFFAAAIQAPIVEETGKGLGLLVISRVARKHFDGPIDGLVYAAWVAAGFAFTENILYFGSALVESGGVAEIFVIRGLMSPFAHVMFTACTGAALGFAAHRTNAFGALGYFLLGLLPALLLHSFWNGALFFVSDFYGYYALVQVPLFIGAVLLVLALRRQESRITFERLSEYAAAGWFNPDEVPALATPEGRRRARAWAQSRGVGRAMKRYTHDATRLAFARHRVVTGRVTIGPQPDEAALLASILDSRRLLQAVPPQ